MAFGALAGAQPSSAGPATLRAPGQVGTVDTLAGPGFCPTTAVPDRSSGRVGAVAVDDAGDALWFENEGPGGSGVTKVEGTLVARALHMGVEWPRGGDVGRGPDRHLSPSRLEADGAGGLLAASPSGIVSVGTTGAVVGSEVPASGDRVAVGDGGPYRAARFASVTAFASDGNGGLFVADEIDPVTNEVAIRFVNRSDEPRTFYAGSAAEVTVAPDSIDTIAGGPTGSNKPAAGLAAPTPALALAGDRLYMTVLKPAAGEVRVLNLGAEQISAHGKAVPPATAVPVVTVKRMEGERSSGSATPVLAGIAVDPAHNLFLAEPANNRVSVVDAAGELATYAGTGRAGLNGNDRPAASARLDRPYDVATGAGGRVYISDAGNDQVRVVDSSGTIRAAPGNGAATRWLCLSKDKNLPSQRAAATGGPTGVVVGEAGGVFFSGWGLAQVKAITRGGRVEAVAGRADRVCATLSDCPTGEDVSVDDVELRNIATIAVRPGGGIYVLERMRVRLLNLADSPLQAHGVTVPPRQARTVAGYLPGTEPKIGAFGEGVSITSGVTEGQQAIGTPMRLSGGRFNRTFAWEGALAADRKGNLFITHVTDGQRFDSSVRQIDPDGIVTDIIPPHPTPTPTTDRLDPRCCSKPSGLAVDDADNLYISDIVGSRVFYLNRGDEVVTVHGVSVNPGDVEAVAGAGAEIIGSPNGSADDAIPARHATLQPWGLVPDGGGNLYVVDLGQHTVRRLDEQGTITNVAGNGQPGFNGDGLKGPLTALNSPWDVALDPCGNLLISDTGNDRIRRLNLVSSCATDSGAADAVSARSLMPVLFGGTAAAAVVVTAAVVLGWRRRRNPGTDADR